MCHYSFRRRTPFARPHLHRFFIDALRCYDPVWWSSFTASHVQPPPQNFEPTTNLAESSFLSELWLTENSSFVKLLTTRNVDYLEKPGHGFWRETFLLGALSRMPCSAIMLERRPMSPKPANPPKQSSLINSTTRNSILLSWLKCTSQQF